MENEQAQEAVQILRQIVKWWYEWNNSLNPWEFGDPPIEAAENLLSELDRKIAN